MTFLLIVGGLWLLAAFFTWALCKTASDSDDVWPELVDEEEWRP